MDEIFAAEISHNSQIVSLEQAKQMAAAWLAAFPDVHYVVDDVFGEGDKVAIRYTGSATHTGEWAGLLPTNNQVTPTGMYIFRFAGGKIVDEWVMGDFNSMFRQIGAYPALE